MQTYLRATCIEQIYPGANLWGSNLSSVNLNQANLQGSNLQEANLEHTILYGALLRGAKLKNANLKSAKFDSKTLLPNAIIIGQDDLGHNLYDRESYWSLETDMECYTNPSHPEFWEVTMPIYRSGGIVGVWDDAQRCYFRP